MNFWFELTPLDTLFFRGSEPMEAGQPSPVPLFPPPVSVLQGALRSAYLKDKGIPFSNYNKGNVTEEVTKQIGKSGEAAPFAITALLIKKDGAYYTPAPANWFIDTDKKPANGRGFCGKSVIVAKTETKDTKAMSLCSSAGTVSLVIAKHEAVSLGGCWVNTELLGKQSITFAANDLLTDKEVFTTENRIGIALDSQRTVVEGKLYSANHIRLIEGITLVAAFDQHPGIADNGLLQLGGEQRKCHYQSIKGLSFADSGKQTGKFVALAPVAASQGILSRVIAAHKPVIISGWDLSRGFHKSTTTWLPAGSVFSEKVSSSSVALSL